MSLLKKIALAWKGREVLAALSNAKRGWKTLSFWITLIGSVLSCVGAMREMFPPQVALIVTTALTAFYNVLRGVTKGEESGVRPWYKTTEFWMGAGAQVQNAFVTLSTGGVSTDDLVKANIILTGVMTVARDLSNKQPSDPPVAPVK